MHKSLALLSAAAVVLSTFPPAANAETLTGTITIEQEGALSEWVLIKPGNKRTSLHKDTYTLEEAPVGNYTLIVEEPAGANTAIETYLDTDFLETVDQPQKSFTLEQGMNLRMKIVYSFVHVGIVSVNSNPPGIPFQLKGPNESVYTGKTPASYDTAPEGLYSVTYGPLENCVAPKPRSDRLIAGSRINFNITISCTNIESVVENVEYQKTIEFVNTVIDGEQVVFEDVPVSQWFAPYVHTALKTGIMSGYRGADGKPNGSYGPGDNVTVAQLAKIAHEIANIDETTVRTEPKNERARTTWAAQYIASAEAKDWVVYADRRIDPERPATRGEVIATLLQAMNIPRNWPTGDLFTDVSRTTTFADSIETAALDEVVGGFTDANGAPTGRFGPDLHVNRAEMAKIITNAIDAYGALE